MQNNIENILKCNPLIPVVTIENLDHIENIYNKLVSRNVKCIEITLRTEVAWNAISIFKAKYGSKLKIGVGTVISVEDILKCEKIGADFIVVHAPILNFVSDRNEVLKNYYNELSSKLNIGIAMWSHPDSGYLMEPELCNDIANLDNIVAIKYSVPRDMYSKLTKLAKDRIIISTASEHDWYQNILELDWKLYLCSSPPYLIQTKNDKRMKKYTDLALNKNYKDAKIIRDSLDPVRKAFQSTKPLGKPHAHQKYWQELLGQIGGRVRFPNLELTKEEKKNIKIAFDECGLIK